MKWHYQKIYMFVCLGSIFGLMFFSSCVPENTRQSEESLQETTQEENNTDNQVWEEIKKNKREEKKAMGEEEKFENTHESKTNWQEETWAWKTEKPEKEVTSIRDDERKENTQVDHENVRVILDREERLKLSTVQMRSQELNEDEPNQEYEYANMTVGIRLHLPYNLAWGTKSYELPPFEEVTENNSIEFGPIGFYIENTFWDRKYELQFLPAMNEQETKKEIMSNLFPETAIQTKERSGITFLEYKVLAYVCPFEYVDILWKKYNYRIIQRECFENEEESTAFHRLHKIIDTIEFLE